MHVVLNMFSTSIPPPRLAPILLLSFKVSLQLWFFQFFQFFHPILLSLSSMVLKLVQVRWVVNFSSLSSRTRFRRFPPQDWRTYALADLWYWFV